MSDIQELIHKTSMDCIDKGRSLERDRIVKLLEENKMTYNLVSIEGEILNATAPLAAPLDKIIALIKGQTID